MDALRAENISVHFGGNQVLNDCTLVIGAGEKRAVIGPNGAGKTTLFNVITGLVKPSSGRVFLFEEAIIQAPAHHRAAKGLARTFQITNLFPKLSVLENMILGVQALTRTKYVFFRPTSSFKQVIARAESLLREWGLWEKKEQLVGNLSHGEQRQLEIILSLAGQPKVLLLDEPTQGLSTAETSLVTSMIGRIDPSIAVLFIEHDMDVAFKVADRLSVLYQGHVLAEGEEADIRGNPQVAEVYLGLETPHAFGQ